jgi:hypothetical protein
MKLKKNAIKRSKTKKFIIKKMGTKYDIKII